ncbi:MAG: hypothetical protein GJV46_07680 [Geobacter sp.]|nr:hypothetical protein [Geobacter sp.]
MKIMNLLSRIFFVALLVLCGCGGGSGGGGVQQSAITQLTINASAGAGGNISPSGVVAVATGSNQIFTITPNTGFSVSDVLVDGVSQGSITTFSFTNVTVNHTISVSFIPNPATAVVTIATQGPLPASVLVGGIQAVLVYSTGKGLSIGTSNVVASGIGASSLFAANTGTSGQVSLALINASGISTGEFATATFSIAAGNFPTPADFSIASGATVIGLNGSPISGVNVVISSVAIQ